MDNDMMMMMFLLLAMPPSKDRNAPLEAWIGSSNYVPAPGRMMWSLKMNADHERDVDQTQLRVGQQVAGLLSQSKLTRADLNAYPDLAAAFDRVNPSTSSGQPTSGMAMGSNNSALGPAATS
jgi:hypothetical protein